MSPLLQRGRAPERGAARAPSGARPVVDLLPDGVRNRRALRAVRVRCVALLLAVVLALVGALAWGWSTRSSAQSRHTAARAESDTLAAQLATYSDLVNLRSEITAVRSAIADGMRNEVLWADLVVRLVLSVPPWADLESMAILIVFETEYETRADDDPFDPGGAIGTVTWVAHVPTLEQSGALLSALDASDGLFGATFTSVDLDEQTGWHKVSGTVRLDDSVRSHRYDDDGDGDDAQEEAA
ncbi:hypothetical protein [Cellulomonas sp. Y8]|uniref:hypothetical protein n=1 Tax=Cellulomonas sp. Y8 TaxID=2591145 RepID=UPI0011CC2041|nr:hypothetical protein [Cellulomonas sp. Y8]